MLPRASPKVLWELLALVAFQNEGFIQFGYFRQDFRVLFLPVFQGHKDLVPHVKGSLVGEFVGIRGFVETDSVDGIPNEVHPDCSALVRKGNDGVCGMQIGLSIAFTQEALLSGGRMAVLDDGCTAAARARRTILCRRSCCKDVHDEIYDPVDILLAQVPDALKQCGQLLHGVAPAILG